MKKPSKLDVFEHLLLDGAVWVYFDGRAPGVKVPPKYRPRPSVMLEFDCGEVTDIDFDELGISATLHFNGEPFWCLVPWSAVFGMRRWDSLGQVWSESMPKDKDEQPREARRLRLVHSRP